MVTARRALNRLNARTVATTTEPGRHADGGNLYLQVTPAQHKSWVFLYTLNGRQREMGLGPVHTVTLARAREKAHAARALLVEGIDPIEHRDAGRDAARLAAVKSMTFRQCATAYIEAHRAAWRNEKHAAQWESTLEDYCGPVFGALPVDKVDTGLVLRAVEPIWREKTETASRVLNRVENVLDWATVRGYRSGDNPARWHGNVEHLLPARRDVAKVEHHAALPFAEVHPFVMALRQQAGTAARALEFTILTAARTAETIGATWAEIDLDESTWTIPAARMKAGKEHRIPLPARAVALLRELHERREGAYVFPGDREGKPLSNMAMLTLLQRRMGRKDLTVHGFRSTFRDWAGERTHHPHDVIEAALAHTIRNAVEAAYRRGDLFEKRRALMRDWARHIETKPAKTGSVVPFGRTG